jgi:hypothetical protein
MLRCGNAARNVLIRVVRRVLGEGAKTRSQRRKRHDEEGRESLHLAQGPPVWVWAAAIF